ncbi:MAG: esterase-like activity of phytase family protein [Magnetospirillum sp.]|nr:esterase-like activity of phytase family protein [Magnetospirillum sp.]
MPDGWLVSFERRHRILFYRHGLSGTPERIDLPQGFTRQPDNGGVEALVRLADGRLLMLSEEGGSDDLGWGWIGEPGAWKRLSYRRTGLFRPTSAAVLPNGDVLVLERSFTLVGGVASRLVRLKAADLRPGAVLEGTELFALRPPLLVDNYEGLTVQKRRDGRLVAYILSDDNFNPLQATLLMAILLPD